MKIKKTMSKSKILLASVVISQAAFGSVASADLRYRTCKIYTADRVFDGHTLYADPDNRMSVILDKDRVHAIMPAADVEVSCRKQVDLGDATIMPGFIESHAHIEFQGVPKDTVLRHGITTVRDTGGPFINPDDPMDVRGSLRHLKVGPIIQAEGGYPLNLFGGHGGHGDEGDDSGHHDDTDHHAASIAVVATTVEQAEEHVEHIANSGAVAIKVALEPGGEAGAPWSGGHGHAHTGAEEGPWPILSQEITNAIVNKAHSLGLPVIAHVGEQVGFDRAIAAGVDELAHLPCAEVSESSVFTAVAQGMRFQTTSDTLSSCHGLAANMHHILHAEAHIQEHHPDFQASVLYASEIGHNDVPWGVNGQEMINNLLSFAGHNPVDFGHVMRVMKSATSLPGSLIGAQIGEPLLGTLQTGAPADLIAVKGNGIERFKLIEYPQLVVSGGKVKVNLFK